MNDREWAIVVGVFNSSNLPFRQRIFVTDGLGAEERPFTIPTSLITSLPVVISNALITGAVAGPAGSAIAAAITSGSAWLGSAVNLGYIMNVGPDAYPDLSIDFPDPQPPKTIDEYRTLLVHETTHVWQGRNSAFALSYVFGSAYSQCVAALSGATTSGAYAATPGQPWGSYNPEQQAQIVEDWYGDGQHGSGPWWPYIRDFVRRGRVS
jgi:hypothetical protein